MKESQKFLLFYFIHRSQAMASNSSCHQFYASFFVFWSIHKLVDLLSVLPHEKNLLTDCCEACTCSCAFKSVNELHYHDCCCLSTPAYDRAFSVLVQNKNIGSWCGNRNVYVCMVLKWTTSTAIYCSNTTKTIELSVQLFCMSTISLFLTLRVRSNLFSFCAFSISYRIHLISLENVVSEIRLRCKWNVLEEDI